MHRKNLGSVAWAALLVIAPACDPRTEEPPADLDTSADTDSDTFVDTGDLDGDCVADAGLRVENGTTASLVSLWVCAGADCTGFIDGLGVSTGAAWELPVCPAPNLTLAVEDMDGRCAVSERFGLAAGETHVWAVDGMDGSWSDAYGGRCVLDR